MTKPYPSGISEGGTEDAEPVGRRFVVRDDHHCFGCGRLNPHGLHLTFYEREEGEGLWSPWTPERVHEGFTGIAHGGVITAVLDEVMGWAVYHREIWAVTGKINVTFRQPVVIGEPTTARGWIIADRGRVLDIAGELRRVVDDALLAEATAVFVRVPEAQGRAWQARYLERG